MGDDIDLVLKITNKSDSKRTVSGRLGLSTMYYTGVRLKPIDQLPIQNREIEPRKSE